LDADIKLHWRDDFKKQKSEASNMNKHKILVCDDENSIRDSLDLILSETYDLKFAATGQEAISEIENDPSIELLLLDIKMPQKSGLDILKEIRSHNNNIAVIMVTGYSSVETANESIKLGALDYISKPFQSKDLLEAVRKAFP